jgi:N-acetylglutamate synthase-like GNAT family acetyltransferase
MQVDFHGNLRYCYVSTLRNEEKNVIRPCNNDDVATILNIINDAASAYRGVIPSDCWHEPYMSLDYLRHELNAGVRFWGYERSGALSGIMGIQHVRDVTLIRHAYVRTMHRNKGIGAELISHLKAMITEPTLVGTWAAAIWAIRFYEKHGFRLVTMEEKNRLLQRYWSISDRQTETSVVLADQKWFTSVHKRSSL